MRKSLIGVLTGALFFAVVGVALALNNNTVDYDSVLNYKGKATGKSPKNLKYTGILEVSTTDGTQPNTAATSDVYFARQIKNNARKFRSCKQSQLDGQATVPRACKRAKVGGGTAVAQLGSPGGNGTPVNLTVGAYNSRKGKTIMLAVTGPAATGINNRVIPGTVTKTASPFAFKVRFKIPENLQTVAGAQVALTNFNVKITRVRKYKVRRHGRRITKRQSYLQMKKCPKSKLVPTRATVFFDNDDGSPGGQTVTSNKTSPCK